MTSRARRQLPGCAGAAGEPDPRWLAEHRVRRAYADGLAGLIRVGPFGDVPGASKLVKVSLLERVPRDDVVVLALRWEATGATGRLFPVLDADLTMTPAGAGHALMRLDGAYRPPLGGVGTGLDRVVVGRAATAAIRSLLARIADALVSPAPAAETAGQPAAGQRPPAGR